MRAKRHNQRNSSSMLDLDKRVRVRRLSNGMKALICENRHVSQAYAIAMFKAGSRYESEADNGLTHVLEHMVFRGAGPYKDSRALNEAAEDIGGMLEAATYRDLVTFSTAAHRSNLEEAVKILASLMTGPKYQHLETEKEIICEEVLESLDAKGRMIDVDNLSHRQIFNGHDLAKPIEGNLSNVKNFTHRDLRRYQKRLFTGSNGVVAISVSKYHKDLWHLLESSFGTLEAGEPLYSEAPLMDAPSGYRHVRHTGSQVEFRLSYRGIAPQDPDYPAMVLLNRILGEGMSSRLQAELIDDMGLAYSLFASSTTYSDCATYDFDCSVAPGKFLSCFEELVKFAHRATRARYSEAEIERSRRRHLYAIEFMGDSPADMTSWYGRHHLYELPGTLTSRQQELDSVTAADLRRVARRSFKEGAGWGVSVDPLDKETREKANALAEQLLT